MGSERTDLCSPDDPRWDIRFTLTEKAIAALPAPVQKRIAKAKRKGVA